MCVAVLKIDCQRFDASNDTHKKQKKLNIERVKLCREETTVAVPATATATFYLII